MFCAGLDLKALHDQTPETLHEFWLAFQDMLLSIYSSKTIVVAELGGHCIAGGYMIALCADSRVAAPGIKVGLNEAAFGLVAPYFGVDMMTHMADRRVTNRAVSLGTLFDTTDAATLNQGLVDVVCSSFDSVNANANASVKETVQAAAIDECELWLRAPGRQQSKELIRAEYIERFRNNREKEARRFVGAVTDPTTQKMIGDYMLALKQKKKK